MDLQTTIYNQVLQPKYLKVYLYIEELPKTKNIAIKLAHIKDIIDTLSDIIVIKEKYEISYIDDLKLLEKYKRL